MNLYVKDAHEMNNNFTELFFIFILFIQLNGNYSSEFHKKKICDNKPMYHFKRAWISIGQSY